MCPPHPPSRFAEGRLRRYPMRSMDSSPSSPSVAPTRVASDLEVAGLDEDHVAGTIHNLVIIVWRFRTRFEPYRAGIRLLEKLSRSHPEGVGTLQIVETEASPPEADARKAFKDALEVPGLRHFSVTHEGTGFKAASVRAIVWGVHTLARPTFPYAVHDSVAEAARWAVEHNRALGRRDDARSIEEAIRELRRLHRERYPGHPG